MPDDRHEGMSLIEKLDQWLLHRTDRLVAWNRDRGRADQWLIADACLDMGIAIFIASFVLNLMDGARFGLLTSAFYILLSFMLGFMRGRERRLIRRLSRTEAGSHEVRTGESGLRQGNLMILAVLAVIWLPMGDIADVAFILAIVVFDATHYFKAADPPPPTRRSGTSMAIDGS